MKPGLLFTLLAWGIAVYGQITVTISPQPSPYTLPPPDKLYAWIACNNGQRVRAVSAGQIRQLFEVSHGVFIDPALLPAMVDRYVERSLPAKLLTLAGYAAAIDAPASSALSAYKSQYPNSGNATTWGYVAVAEGVVGFIVPYSQNKLQAAVTAERATITTSVKAALMLDMGEVSTISVGGCSNNVHRMFVGSGVDAPVKVVLP